MTAVFVVCRVLLVATLVPAGIGGLITIWRTR